MMMQMLGRVCKAVLPFAVLVGCGGPQTKLTKEQRIDEIEWVISKVEHNYAPLKYKQELLKFDWEQKKADFRARAAEDIDNETLQVLVREFVATFADAHTSVIDMYNTRPELMKVAYLGIMGKRLKEANDDGFLVTDFLPSYRSTAAGFPISKGDLVTKVNELDVYSYVAKHCRRDLGQEESNKTLLIPALQMFNSLDCKMPAEPSVVLTVKRGTTTKEVTLPWVKKDYVEFVKIQKAASASEVTVQNARCSKDAAPSMECALAKRFAPLNIEQYAKYLTQRIAAQGSSVLDFSVQTITPDMLMAPVTAVETEPVKVPDGMVLLRNKSFDIRVIKLEGGLIGYVRVPTFSVSDSATYVADMKEALKTIDALSVKGLVLDLVNNGGGSLEYGLKLAELFKPQNYTEPTLKVRLNDNWLDSIQSEALFGSNDSNRQLAQTLYGKLQADAAEGKWLSEPFKLSQLSVSERTPDLKARPVVLMVNEMCASMCDIFTADLKDNSVATVIGKKTMGAGGNVVQHGFSPRLNLMMSQTESLIVRANGEYIENKGIDPDVAYEPTRSDLSNSYADFIKAAAALALSKAAK